MSESRQDDGLGEFERQLMTFSPRDATLDRSALLFRAGQESMRGRARRSQLAKCFWPVVAATFAGLSLHLYWQPNAIEPRVVERIRYVQAPLAAQSNNNESVGERSSQPSNLSPIPATGVKSQAPRRDFAPRNHYLNRRQLALTVGLDALNAPSADGGSHDGEPRSYRNMKSHLLNIERARERKENSDSANPGIQFGDNT